MKGRFLTAEMIAEFREHLILEERSEQRLKNIIGMLRHFPLLRTVERLAKKW